MNRRRFLSVLSSATLWLGAGGCAWRSGEYLERRLVKAVVRARLDYLTLDEAGLEEFAQQVIARDRHVAAYCQRYKWRAFFGRAYDILSEDPAVADPKLKPHNRYALKKMAREFLLGSDFFMYGADESRTVHFVGYYDPYARGCGNPFTPLV